MTLAAQRHESGIVTEHFGFAPFGDRRVTVAVTRRVGGCSHGCYDSLNLAFHVGDEPDAVRENRRRVCAALGLERLACPDQQHGAHVAVLDESLAGAGHGSAEDACARLPSTDGLVTDRPGLAISIGMADCAPVVLYDPARSVIGVAHAGRRGVVLDVIGATVRAMADGFGCDPRALRAGIGPCIAAESYEIGPAEVAEVEASFGDELLSPTAQGRARFDLARAAVQRLWQAGVDGAHIEVAGSDTRANPERYFSDRAERPCGRMLLVAALR